MVPNLSSYELDNDEHRIRIESLGRVVNENNQQNFERILKNTHLSGTYDITNWTFEAVKVLFEICAHTKQRITLKQGARYFMLVQYPHGPMLETLAEAIVSGNF